MTTPFLFLFVLCYSNAHCDEQRKNSIHRKYHLFPYFSFSSIFPLTLTYKGSNMTHYCYLISMFPFNVISDSILSFITIHLMTARWPYCFLPLYFIRLVLICAQRGLPVKEKLKFYSTPDCCKV